MIKDIVVNLGLGERDPAGDFAISVADAFEAHLLGVAFSYDPIIPGTVMGGIPPEFIESQRRESEKRRATRLPASSRRPSAPASPMKPAASMPASAAPPNGSATWRGASTWQSSASPNATGRRQRKSWTKACCSNPAGR